MGSKGISRIFAPCNPPQHVIRKHITYWYNVVEYTLCVWVPSNMLWEPIQQRYLYQQERAQMDDIRSIMGLEIWSQHYA